MLKKEVCKKCRIDDYGEEEGWNEFAEAWFETNQHRVGHVFCPPNVTQVVNRSIADKMSAVLTYEEQDLESVRHLLRKLINSPCLQARSNIPPPWWCPHAAEHGEEE